MKLSKSFSQSGFVVCGEFRGLPKIPMPDSQTPFFTQNDKTLVSPTSIHSPSAELLHPEHGSCGFWGVDEYRAMAGGNISRDLGELSIGSLFEDDFYDSDGDQPLPRIRKSSDTHEQEAQTILFALSGSDSLQVKIQRERKRDNYIVSIATGGELFEGAFFISQDSRKFRIYPLHSFKGQILLFAGYQELADQRPCCKVEKFGPQTLVMPGEIIRVITSSGAYADLQPNGNIVRFYDPNQEPQTKKQPKTLKLKCATTEHDKILRNAITLIDVNLDYELRRAIDHNKDEAWKIVEQLLDRIIQDGLLVVPSGDGIVVPFFASKTSPEKHSRFGLIVAEKLHLPILGDRRSGSHIPRFGNLHRNNKPFESPFTHPREGLQLKPAMRGELLNRYVLVTHYSAYEGSVFSGQQAILRSLKKGKEWENKIINLVLYASSER